MDNGNLFGKWNKSDNWTGCECAGLIGLRNCSLPGFEKYTSHRIGKSKPIDRRRGLFGGGYPHMEGLSGNWSDWKMVSISRRTIGVRR